MAPSFKHFDLKISLLNTIKEVFTFDIIPFDQKRNNAINFKNFFISNRDIYNLIPYSEKEVINFKHINFLNESFLKDNEYKFDLAFVDGCHNDYEIILNDFKEICMISQ